MNNNQMPGMSGVPQMQQMPPMQPMQPAGPTQYQTTSNGMPMVQQVQLPPKPTKDAAGLIKTIAIVILSLVAVTFIGLFIWMLLERNEAQTDIDTKIQVAEAAARDEQSQKMEAEFLEREKYPYKTFSGPADYGQLTFEYPRTWSLYIEKAATAGGDFNAYFNPIQVDAVSEETINALRVAILNQSFDEVSKKYQKYVDDEGANLKMESVTIGANNNITANRYTGTIPDTELNGYIVIFKIRDKTVILQTDATPFADDYNKLLGTVTFNE